VNPTVQSSPSTHAGAAHSSGSPAAWRSLLLDPLATAPVTALMVAAAVLMVGSGAVHVYLWHLAYRHVATLGPLFLVQAIAALVLAVILAVTRRGLVAVGAIGLMAGTIVGFILVTTVGLFGFTLHSITGWADLALATEAGAIVLLAVAARLLWQSATSPS
jgi:hypothetical protein